MQSGDVSPTATVVLGGVGAETEQSAHSEVEHADRLVHELTLLPIGFWIGFWLLCV